MNDKDKPAANKNTNDNAEIKKTPANKTTISSEKDNKNTSGKPTLSSRILLILIVFIAGMAISIYLMPTLQERLPFVANWVGNDASNDVAILSQRSEAQQNEIADLRNRTEELESTINTLMNSSNITLPSDFEARISALETLADALPTSSNEGSEPTADTSQSTRIDMLLSRMSQLEASFVPLSQNMLDAGQASQERAQLVSETATLNNKITELESRLSNVEQMASKDNSGILLNLKIADLKRSFERGLPYAVDIAAIEQIIDGGNLNENSSAASAINMLKLNSAAGTATIEQSMREFNALIPEILKEEGIDPEASWITNTWNGLKNLVTIRQTDGRSPTASELDNLISQIELNLQQRNPQEAVNLTDRLPLQTKSLLNDWRSNVQATIDGSNAIITLERLATESYLLEDRSAITSSEAN